VPRLLHLSEADKVLVLERGSLMFLFNFHSSCSVSDYPVRVPPGKYRGILNSDELRFGGQGRITADQAYPLLTETRESECVFLLRVYLPCRTALLLAKP
jgi:1,4-alpha-glucan branching enzyme